MRTRVDVDGMDDLIAVLGSAGRRAVSEGRKVVTKGSLNIKTDWRNEWDGHPSISPLSRAVTYDVDTHDTTITGDIGPDPDKRQGPLDNIIEFGGINFPAPLPAGVAVLNREEPKFIRAVEELGEQLLRERR